MQDDELKQRWFEMFLRANPGPPPESLLAREWDCILSRYGEPHRHYHNLTHVVACLHWLDRVREQVNDPRTLELALWFHDLVYNPRRNDNEAISAEYAVATLSLLGEPAPVREAVKDLILVTRHPSHPVTPDQCWMVDIDLAILGAAPDHYDAYAAAVRQEYGHVPDALYAAGRTAVLTHFLAAPNLYHGDGFRTGREAAARANLQREITHWQHAFP